MTRVALLGTRLLGVLAAVYVGALCAGNLHSAWDATGHVPGIHYTNWPGIAFLSGGIVLAGLVLYVVLRSSTLRSTSARVAMGVIGLFAYLFLAVKAIEALS